MNTCPHCGTRFSANERLCPHDGTVLEPDQPSELEHIGQVLDNKYRLDSYLSRGGMGAVYRATHVMLGRPVAVKLINPDLVTSPDIVRRFQREARAVTHLNHPNIVEVYDLGQTADGTLYIAMELVAGESLGEVIRSSGPLPPSRTVNIMRQVVSALALAHRKEIVHRDLKPHNIMITRGDDGVETAKLLDFGIAKTFEFDANTQLTAAGSTMGTPKYMSPEQAMGMAVDARSDLYSLGIILYEMLIGEVPFSDPSLPAMLVKHMNELPVPPSQRRPDLQISPALESIALRCLEKDPAKRFQTAGEIGAELQRVPIEAAVDGDAGPMKLPVMPVSQTVEPTVLNRSSEPGTRPTAAVAAVAAPTPLVAQPRPPRSRSLLVPTAAIVVLLGILGGGYWAMTRHDAPRTAVDASQPPAATPAGAQSPKPEPLAAVDTPPAPVATPAGADSAKPEPPAAAPGTPAAVSPGDSSTPGPTAAPPREVAAPAGSLPPSRTGEGPCGPDAVGA
jgi:serine/threonine protein kinase